MSARNYLSASEKNCSKLFIDTLPTIQHQNFGFRSGQELPTLSATGSLVNRNINYSFEVPQYVLDDLNRAGTPFSDFFSESETGSPDFRSEESDSSAGSALRRSTAEATRILAEEWERIERTLYDEEGEKCTRPHMVEECRQWQELHPQLRIIGKAVPLPEKRTCYRQNDHDEIIDMHYIDYELFSESEERLSQSSTDVTPQNSPRPSISDDLCVFEPKLFREKILYFPTYQEDDELPDSFNSLLQITPIHIRSPQKRRSSILRSELASSRWMRGSRPESSMNCDRNSAKSFMSDTRNGNHVPMSASNRDKMLSSRVVTARHREVARLEPLNTSEWSQDSFNEPYISQRLYRKVSLPPLKIEEEKRKVSGSPNKHNLRSRRNSSKTTFHFDKAKYK